MKKILVSIDIAREGGNAAVIKTARAIAGAMGGSLALVYVIEPTPTYILAQVPAGIVAQRKLDAEKELSDLAAQYEIPDSLVCEGAPATMILEYAAKIDADLIVLHSHDPDLSDYFLGSVAGRVVRHAHCSVHIVRHLNKNN